MRTLVKLLPLIAFLVLGCNRPYKAAQSSALVSNVNSQILDSIETVIRQLESAKGSGHMFLVSDTATANWGRRISIYSELVDLFNPDNFTWGLSDDYKDRLKTYEREGFAQKGFVPDIVFNSICKDNSAIKLDNRGAMVLAHYFTYQSLNGAMSKPIVAIDVPSEERFDAAEYMDLRPEGYANFFFTMDCAGYFAASAKIAGGGKFLWWGVDAEAEGQKSINQNQSIVIIKGLMSSPLYQAYTGTKRFGSDTDRAVVENRIKTLQGIVRAIPPGLPGNTRVFLNQNYEAIFTSNKGKAGYNGTADLNANIQFSFLVAQGKAGTSYSTSVDRKCNFTDYSTYILNMNVDASPDTTTIASIADSIVAIRRRLPRN